MARVVGQSIPVSVDRIGPLRDGPASFSDDFEGEMEEGLWNKATLACSFGSASTVHPEIDMIRIDLVGINDAAERYPFYTVPRDGVPVESTSAKGWAWEPKGG
jgi:hypothetical protein